MPRRGKRVSRKVGREPAKSAKPRVPDANANAGISGTTENNKASDRFKRDLLVRGEAAKVTKGKLPAHATHAITQENEDGTVEVKRARFKLF
jgi:hypothetical protein